MISLVNAVPRAKAYGLKSPEFCLDNGFFSTENVLRFLRKNFKFIPNEEAILAAQKDFGIFVILSNLHASPWDALRCYRRRNDIETSYRVVKSDLDGRKRERNLPTRRTRLPFRAAEHDGAHGSGSRAASQR